MNKAILATLGTLVVATIALLAAFVRPPIDVDGTGYVRRCARWGWNLGLSSFATTYLTNQELARACGRDTTFDVATRMCVPRTRRACDVDMSVPRFLDFPEFLREGECQQRGCSFDRDRNRCDARRECRVAHRREWCDRNPNCAWSDRTMCRPRGAPPDLMLRTGCGGGEDAMDPVATLCGPGTTFHAARGVCELDDKM